MFGSMFRDFDEDPFFRDMQDRQRSQMQSMQSMFNPGFGSMMPSPFMALEDGSMGQQSRTHRSRDRQALQPFGMSDPFTMGFGSMFGNMQNMMANMHQNFEQMANNPNVHSYSHSSFTSFSSNGSEAPQVYQATSSTRKAPGGVKETRRSVRDSTAGLEKMAVGHHLDDRAHVMERSRNTRTGDMEEKQDFTNLDETEADSFNNEWRHRAHPYDRHQAVGSRHRHHTPAITNGRHEHGTVRRDRSPARPTGPNPAGRDRGHNGRRNQPDTRTHRHETQH